MRIETVTPQAVRLRISRSELSGVKTISEEQARIAVSEALAESGQPPWEQMEVSVFPGFGEVLIIARQLCPKPVRFRFRRFSHLAAAADYLPNEIRSDLYATQDGFELLLYGTDDLPNAVYEFGEALPCPPEMKAHLSEQGDLIAEKNAVSILWKAFAAV